MANRKIYLTTPGVFMEWTTIRWYFENRIPIPQLMKRLREHGIFTVDNIPSDHYIHSGHFKAYPPLVDEESVFHRRRLFVSSKGVQLLLQVAGLQR
ncbi:MAG TPA: hypothetical protein VGN63_13215 [Flavisolibacter sp.]|nr:hypothetical protein [Flavisolibacter sp.]